MREKEWTKDEIKKAFSSKAGNSRFINKLRESGRIREDGEQILIVNSADISVCFLLERCQGANGAK